MYCIVIKPQILLSRPFLRSFASTTARGVLEMRNLLNPWDGLGLTRTKIMSDPQVEENLLMIPEISEALCDPPAGKISTDKIQRAIDIFSAMEAGGSEHQASLMLQAEAKHYNGDSKGVYSTLKELEKNNVKKDVLTLAHAKLLWLNGDFAQAQTLCDSLLPGEELSLAMISASLSSTELSARMGQALSRLLLVRTLDDVYSVRDPFRMIVKLLQRSSPVSLASAAAYLNSGVAESIYVQVIQKEHNLESVPWDAAMRNWNEGLTILSQCPKSVRGTQTAMALEARLYANLAWGALQMNGDTELIKRASEFARDSMKIYDDAKNKHGWVLGGWSRTLSLVAQCYHKSGSAVTAQGLLQTAIDEQASRSTLEMLNHRDAILGFSHLCEDWEKRQSEADQLKEKAEKADNSLPGGWKGKSGIHSSLWFWLPMQCR